jgi:hypothetical protein
MVLWKSLAVALLVGLFTSLVGRHLMSEEPTNPNSEATVQEIRDLQSTLQKLSVPERQEKLKYLEKLGERTENTWKAIDKEKYAQIMLELAGTLASSDFGDKRQYYLSKGFALGALQVRDAIPLDLECNLVRYAHQNVGPDGKALPETEWPPIRKSYAQALLHAWQRVEKTIDVNWDPDDMGVRHVLPPGGVGFIGGASPDMIKDPQLRAEYEAAVLANKKKLDHNSEQIRARRLRQYWIPGAERSLFYAYSKLPDGSAELQALLEQYNVGDADRRAEIVQAVKDKKLPERLVIRFPQTQPAK